MRLGLGSRTIVRINVNESATIQILTSISRCPHLPLRRSYEKNKQGIGLKFKSKVQQCNVKNVIPISKHPPMKQRK